jgi:hypothetical protein
MPTVMSMEWPGVTQDQYNQVMRALELDKNPPSGCMLHMAAFNSGMLRCMDIWESQQVFEKFQKERLTAAVQKAGITTQPKVQFFPVYNIYVPNMEAIRKTGSSSMPTAAA